MPVSYWDNTLNTEHAANYFVVSKEEREELTWEENILWYLTLVQQLKNSPVTEIYGQIWWWGAIIQRLLCFFSNSVC